MKRICAGLILFGYLVMFLFVLCNLNKRLSCYYASECTKTLINCIKVNDIETMITLSIHDDGSQVTYDEMQSYVASTGLFIISSTNKFYLNTKFINSSKTIQVNFQYKRIKYTLNFKKVNNKYLLIVS